MIFSFQGQTPWGQDGVKGHTLSYGQFFTAYFDRGVKLDHFFPKDHRSNPYMGAPEVKEGHMSSYEQKIFIAYFDRGVKVDHCLSREHRSNAHIGGARGQKSLHVVL